MLPLRGDGADAAGERPDTPAPCGLVSHDTALHGDTDAGRTGLEAAARAAELHLVVVWSSGRSHERAILADLRDRFDVLRVHEVHWTPELVPQNYSRFYRGRLVPPYRNVETRKGSGPLLAVTVLDRAPDYAVRDTLHGEAVVNANLFDAKVRYREWTGPGHLVHGSDTAAEANRDLMLLLGCTTQAYLERHPGSWDGTIRPVQRDLSGARGWDSAGQMLEALNCSVDYVVLGGADPVRMLEEETDATIELLTDSYKEIIAVTNARPLLRQIPPWGGRFLIRVGERNAPFAFRFVGDHYFDPKWQRAVLERRVWCERGYFKPQAQDDLETLAYHALIHEPSLTPEHKARMLSLARALGREDTAPAAPDDEARIKRALDVILEQHGYAYVQPLDVFAFYNFHAAGVRFPGTRRRVADLRRAGAHRYYRWAAQIRARYFTARDLLARSAPGVRGFLRLLRGRRKRAGFKAPTLPHGGAMQRPASTAALDEHG